MVSTFIIGGGPAGLTAALELDRLGVRSVVFEKDPIVGGISRTVSYKGYRFDIGGHRFFTKVPLVMELWRDLLGDDLLERPRLSRIYYNDRFFDYPLKPMNALRGLGPFEAMRVGLSYLKAQLVPHPVEHNFEQWVANRFGRRLYQIFFKTYTEKVWGMSCTEISADWAAQRIKNLDLLRAVRNALLGSSGDQEVITTLIDRFHYPRFGPGMMWERCRDRLENNGVRVELGTAVERLHHDGSRLHRVTVRRQDGTVEQVDGEQFISSMPLRELVFALEPDPPPEVLGAASRLRYRDFLTVVLILARDQVFPDNWIYIHSPKVKVGRVQNFKNWSPEMVPDPANTSLGLEYFVHQGDELWSAADDDLIELGKREMEQLGLIEADEVVDGTVVRMPKAYPIYDDAYRDSLTLIRGYLSGMTNLQVIGRNGQHRYNNQDHSMLAGVYAARNVNGAKYDVWSVNVEEEYHEEVVEVPEVPEEEVGRLVPAPVAGPDPEELIRAAFARYDPVALGAALGSIGGLSLFLATVALLVQGGDPLGPTLSLLGHYFLGYKVSWAGAFYGLGEAALGGYVLGYLMARTINLLVRLLETTLRRELEFEELVDPLSAGEP